MSIYGLTMNAHLDPDPYVACHHEVTEHPHYRDCSICRHAKYGTCVYGRIHIRGLWLDANSGNEEAQIALKDMDIDYRTPLEFWD